MGIRRIEDINQAMGLKLVWRLLNSNSVWADWMRKCYIKSYSFWDLPPSPFHSGTMKFLIRNRPLAIEAARRVTGNAGELSFKEAWEVSRTHSNLFDLYRLFWFPSVCPKMATCSLRAYYGKLQTKDVLIRHGAIGVSPTCVLCGGCAESVAHLFFHCEYSHGFWSLLRSKLGWLLKDQYSIIDEAGCFHAAASYKSKEGKMIRHCFSMAIWALWAERNRRCFEGKSMGVRALFKQAEATLGILIQF